MCTPPRSPRLATSRRDPLRGVIRAIGVAALVCLAACFPKPLDLHVADASTGAPVDGVALHRHAISLLTLLPSRQDPVRTTADGSARVWIPPLNTNVTLLRPGYEPASVAVYRTEVPESMKGGTRRQLLFQDLKEGEVFEMRMQPCTRTPTRVQLVDAPSGKPIAGADVLARTFLYLPAPGLEDGWGFPDLQSAPTGAEGVATIDRVSGFRNRVTARMPGWADTHADLRAESGDELTLRARPLRWKNIRFEVLDEKRGTPVEGAWVSLDEPRNGLPPDPNAFAACTLPDGLTPPVAVPDVVPLVLAIRAPGHRDRRESLDWNAVRDGDVRTIWVHRNGWFE